MTRPHGRPIDPRRLAPLILTTLLALALIGTATATPSVTIDNPTGGETHSGGAVTINGTTGDAATDVSNVTLEYSTDGGSTFPNTINTIANGSFTGTNPNYNWTHSWDSTSISESTQVVIRATATNSTNATTTDTTGQFTVDNQDPSITNESPTGTIGNSGPTVSANYSDGGSGIDTNSVVLTLDGTNETGNASVGASGVSLSTSGLSDGQHNVTLNVSDDVGRTATSSWSFTVSNPGPAISNLQPSDGSTISSTSTTLSADYSDPDGVDDSSAVLTLDGNTVKTGGSSGSISYSTGTLSAGSHNAGLTVNDSLGNTNSTSWSFTVPSSSGDRVWDANDNPSLDYTWDSDSFGGFFFSFTDGLGTESMTVHLDSDSDRDVDEGDLEYRTDTENVTFDRSGWGKYRVVGFMGEKYFAGYSSATGKGPFAVDESLLQDGALSRVLLDHDDDDNFVVGESMELENNYQLRVVEIDVNGDQVWLELYKSGKQVDSEFVSSGSTYTYETEVAGNEDVPVIGVGIESVFRGTESSVVTTDGVFQISENPRDVDTGESFGEMEVSTTTSTSLEMENEDDISLNSGQTKRVFGDVGFEIADSSTLRFAPTVLAEGTREARGTVASGTKTWTVNNFEGFYYDIDEDVGTEKLEVKSISSRTIQEDDLEYTTNAQEVDFEFNDWGKFEVIGFMAEKYFAGYTSDPDFTDGESVLSDGWLSKVLIDSDSDRTVFQGTTLKLRDGYELRVNQVDVDGSQAMLQLYRDGEAVDGSTDIVGTGETYTFEKDVEGIDDLPLIAVHVDSVFRGGESSVLIVDGVFQISEDLRGVSGGDEFGKMEISSTSASSLTMQNEGRDVQLNRDSEVSLMGNVSFRVTDTSSLLYAPIAVVPGAQPSDGEPGAGEQEDRPLNVTVSPERVPVGTVAEITARSNGSPVEGVSVSVNDVPVGTTDSQGRALFTPNASGTYAVEASGEGYVTASTTFTAAEAGLFVEKPSRAVAGEAFTLRFIDEEGDPVQGVRVSLDGESIGTTGSNGTLRHAVNESGVYSLRGEKTGAGQLVTDLRVSEPASLEVVNVIVGDAVADSPTRFDVVARNPGGVRFNGTLQMRVGGDVVDTRVVSLAPGEVTTVEFAHTFGSTLFGSPEQAEPRVSFDGHEVQMEVQGNAGKRNLTVLGILVLIAAVGGALAYYFGPERVRSEVHNLRTRAEARASEVRERAQDRFGDRFGDRLGGPGDEGEEEPFIGDGKD